MPETITRTDDRQVIGGAFSDQQNADEAVQALKDLGVHESDIQVVAMVDCNQAKAAAKKALTGRGIAESEALFYGEAIKKGKILVAVHNVVDPAPVIEIFDNHQAEYNPDGSRNLRHDVAGLTAGAAVGAAAGIVAGTAVAGPLGGAVGAAAGAVVGGGAGAAVGKVTENQK